MRLGEIVRLRLRQALSPDIALSKLKSQMGSNHTLEFHGTSGYWEIYGGRDQEDLTGLVAQALGVKPVSPEWKNGKIGGDPETLAQQLQLVLGIQVKVKKVNPSTLPHVTPKKKK